MLVERTPVATVVFFKYISLLHIGKALIFMCQKCAALMYYSNRPTDKTTLSPNRHFFNAGFTYLNSAMNTHIVASEHTV
jgi:hypothetical protein